MTTILVPAQRPSPAARRPAEREPLPDWTCVNCDEPNAGRRRRCRDCGTTRD